MREVGSRLFVLVFVILFPALARADSIVTLDLSASFVPRNSHDMAIVGSGPTLFVTGQFTVDEVEANTSMGTVIASMSVLPQWNMTFLGPAGASLQLSPQNGGVGGCPVVKGTQDCTLGLTDISFGNSSASLFIEIFAGYSPLFTGENLQFSQASETVYPGHNVVNSPPCLTTSTASFENQRDAVYSLIGPGGCEGGVCDTGPSSGFLTVASVVSTPEPPESTALLLGIIFIFGCSVFRKRTGIRAE